MNTQKKKRESLQERAAREMSEVRRKMADKSAESAGRPGGTDDTAYASTAPTVGVTDLIRGLHEHTDEIDEVEFSGHLPTSCIKVSSIYNRDPKSFEGPDWDAFVASITESGGNVVPIEVRRTAENGIYELITGERRYRACMQGGFKVRANVREISSARRATLFSVENLFRQGKSIYDQGRGFKDLMASGEFATEADLARRLHISKGTMSEAVGLIDALPEEVWSKVVKPSSLTRKDTRLISDAAGGGELAERFLARCESRKGKTLPAKALVTVAREILKRKAAETHSVLPDAFRFVRYKGKHDAMVLPEGLTDAQKGRLAEVLAKELQAIRG